MRSTTTDPRWLVDLGSRLSRLAASTGDRELGALVTATVGGGVRVAITDPNDETQMGITLQGETMQTRFFDALYVTTRIAAYGALGFDLELR